ncbi:hypothetical protein CA54_03000 [Symmachiella macrocystis]|uniref:Uncharacterized protein n=1 Tax=Symmachiella macrocystis TaxID=2527985 RepID=A0A5C6BH66_9PLAN|nr:hypothetical protein CA54_03000 [Symmachiella macrocystis]
MYFTQLPLLVIATAADEPLRLAEEMVAINADEARM